MPRRKVLFDLDAFLTEPEHDGYAALAAQPRGIGRALWATLDERCNRGEISPAELYAQALRAFKTEEELLRACLHVAHEHVLVPGAKELFELLWANGASITVVSNGLHEIAVPFLARHGLEADVVANSFEIVSGAAVLKTRDGERGVDKGKYARSVLANGHELVLCGGDSAMADGPMARVTLEAGGAVLATAGSSLHRLLEQQGQTQWRACSSFHEVLDFVAKVLEAR